MNNHHKFHIIFWVFVLMLIAGCGKKTEQNITVPSPDKPIRNTYLEQRYQELMEKDRSLKDSLANRQLNPLTRNIIEDLRMMNISLIQIIVRQMQEDNAHLKALLESHRQLLQSELSAKEERYHTILKEFVKALPKPHESQPTPPNVVQVPKPSQSRSHHRPLRGYPQQFTILIEVVDWEVDRSWLSLPLDKEVTWIGERYEGRSAISILGTPHGDVYEVNMPLVSDGFEWVTADWKGRR